MIGVIGLAAPAAASAAEAGWSGRCYGDGVVRQLPDGRELSLHHCYETDRPGSRILWMVFLDWSLRGDTVMLAYKPYYAKGFVPGSEVASRESGTSFGTPYFFGNVGELQACAKVAGELYCLW